MQSVVTVIHTRTIQITKMKVTMSPRIIHYYNLNYWTNVNDVLLLNLVAQAALFEMIIDKVYCDCVCNLYFNDIVQITRTVII